MKIRFLEPGNPPYRPSPLNWFVYDRTIRTPSNGMLILATILHRRYEDVYCYSESISRIVWDDVLDADVICLSIFTFSANRGYELADYIRQHSSAVIIIGGLHATLCAEEALAHADYVLTGEGDESLPRLVAALETHTVTDGIPGVYYWRAGRPTCDTPAVLPHDIETIPDRTLLYRFKEMAGHSTIWAQVHASRGCPYHCDYCSLVAAFGSGVRCRAPETVVEDIRQAIDFFDTGHHRLARMLWITDDNFFANRSWAISVLQALIESDINYTFTIQARYEVGFDDEMLNLLARAGFIEIAMGIEFLEDEAFELYHKTSTYSQIEQSVANIKRHGLRVRGLFIVGADNHEVGVGDRLADFVISHDIDGVLVQSMYFIPGTPVYKTHQDQLFDTSNWSRNMGKVVHYPQHMTAVQLQCEMIHATKRIYSFKRLVQALLCKRGINRMLFLGEWLWYVFVRADLRRDLSYLREKDRQEQVAHHKPRNLQRLGIGTSSTL